MMRITSGIFKGRKLISPKGNLTRPTSEKLRSMIFNICQNKIIDAHFFDLFAGSGAMGLEALSRGAKRATFVDQSRFAIEAISKNIELLEVKNCTSIISLDAKKALSSYQGDQIDILYIDPPYSEANQLLPPIMSFLDANTHLFHGDAWIFIEEDMHAKTALPPMNHIELFKEKKVGTTHLMQFIVHLNN
ncbi:MAG: 16S rRNA (guanine(966)-N(2))-methyltransferase RsmD [Chlamydiae bacterium]|nr:16S rRNA (guanine(966)-N(2))-methyltransferase RsmD [Chlamydiota bacterium]